jgi:cytochrome d ubiquinol oxidase subunit I
MTFSGWVAVVAGWYTTEIGRQPWLVSGVLRTADAVSAVPAPMVGMSLAMYLTVYAVLLLAYMSVVFYLARSGSKAEPGTEAPGGWYQPAPGAAHSREDR